MKNLLLASVAFLALIHGAQVAAQDLKIGFVSTERVFREAVPAVDAMKRLEKEFKPREDAIKKVNDEED